MYRVVTIRLERPLYGGLTLGYHEGKAVMVPYGIPGETAIVTIIDEKKDYCTGTIERIVEQSPSRIPPRCPHFTNCGGCSYAHLSYDAELEIKKRILLDSLSRIGGFGDETVPRPDMVAGNRFHYRSHATLRIVKGMHGFHRKGSNDLVAINSTGCNLLADPLNVWIMGGHEAPGDYRAAIGSDNRVVLSFQDEPIVDDSVSGYHFTRHIDCFFQANLFLRPRMLEIVKDYAGPSRDESLLDIGCGVGFLSIVSGEGSSVTRGIDLNAESIRWAKINARQNGALNTDFITIPSSRLHPARHRADVLLADPPRAGLDRRTRRTILAMAPRRIVYASCNPATFSRDAKEIVSGGYRMDRLTLLDMFPCTHHIELIACFTRLTPQPTQ